MYFSCSKNYFINGHACNFPQGNVGDSRAVACIKGKDHPLSADHKPNNPMESMRIKDAGKNFFTTPAMMMM